MLFRRRGVFFFLLKIFVRSCCFQANGLRFKRFQDFGGGLSCGGLRLSEVVAKRNESLCLDIQKV